MYSNKPGQNKNDDIRRVLRASAQRATRRTFRKEVCEAGLPSEKTLILQAEEAEPPRHHLLWQRPKRGRIMRGIAAAKADHRADKAIPLVRYRPEGNDVWVAFRGRENKVIHNPELGRWSWKRGVMMETPAKVRRMKERRMQKRWSSKCWREQECQPRSEAFCVELC